MAEVFEGDLAGAVFWGADLRGARFRDVDLTDARITHAWLVDVEIDALVERLVVNGVDVTAFVNERDPWYPLRSMLRPTDAEGMRAAWEALDEACSTTLARAGTLPEEALHRSVDGEWSLVETLRHLVYAMDKWFTAPIAGGAVHPIGLTHGASAETRRPLADVLAVRSEQGRRFRQYLEALTPDELDRPVDVVENGGHLVRECLLTIFEEEFWHNRYAVRDLARLEP